MQKTKHILLLVLLLACVDLVRAQDLHFSQFFNSPLLTNPANCGFIPDGDYRMGANYREQWASLSAFPYKTMSVYGDAQLLQNDYNSGWLGIGGVLLRDVAGTGVLTSTKLYGSLAYHQMINYSSLLSLGFNVGWSNKQINTVDLTFPSQWNGQFFDAHQLATAPLLSANNINYFDLQVGVNYAYFPNENVYLNTGFSASHLNKPKETFFSATTPAAAIIPVRYTGFINGSFKLNDQIIINPNAYISFQAKSSEWVGGLNAHYNISGDGAKVLIAGAYYRLHESIIPMVGLGLKDYEISFSYDVTGSGLKSYNGSRGAFEFSLVKKGVLNRFKGNKQETICPSFK
jgi:type IX secretion system PorP/SprF family membrane protein